MTDKQLSPAAQAIWDAWNDAYEAQGPLEDMGHPIAAALRAVAGQVFPINYVIIDNCQYEAPNPEREQILTIAAELEGK